jgi:hypothetical protein
MTTGDGLTAIYNAKRGGGGGGGGVEKVALQFGDI